MKYAGILVFAVMVIVCSKGDNDIFEKMLKFVEPCTKETNVNPAAIDKLIKKTEFTDDKDFKCFIKCMYTKSEVMSDNGDFNEDELKKTLEEDQSPDLLNKCKNLKGSDPCDTAFLVAKCMEGQ